MKTEYQLLDELDEEILHDEDTTSASTLKEGVDDDIPAPFNKWYEIDNPDPEESMVGPILDDMEIVADLVAKEEYFEDLDKDGLAFVSLTDDRNNPVVIVINEDPVSLTPKDIERALTRSYKPFGHDSYDSGYYNEPDPEEDGWRVFTEDADLVEADVHFFSNPKASLDLLNHDLMNEDRDDFEPESGDVIDPVRAQTEGGKLRAAFMKSMEKDYGFVGQANEGNEKDDLRTPKCEFDVDSLYAGMKPGATPIRTFVEAEEVAKRKLTELGYDPSIYTEIKITTRPAVRKGKNPHGPLLRVAIPDNFKKKKNESLNEGVLNKYNVHVSFSWESLTFVLDLYEDAAKYSDKILDFLNNLPEVKSAEFLEDHPSYHSIIVVRHLENTTPDEIADKLFNSGIGESLEESFIKVNPREAKTICDDMGFAGAVEWDGQNTLYTDARTLRQIIKEAEKYNLHLEDHDMVGLNSDVDESLNEAAEQFVYGAGCDLSDEHLLDMDIESLKDFNLKLVGIQKEENDPFTGTMWIKGTERNIARYLDDYVGGIQINYDWLIPAEDFESTISYDRLMQQGQLTEESEYFTTGSNKDVAVGSVPYNRIKAVCDKLNTMDLVDKWHNQEVDFTVEPTYEDFGADMRWKTIICREADGDHHQILSPRDWMNIANGVWDVDTAIQEILNDKYCQFKLAQPVDEDIVKQGSK